MQFRIKDLLINHIPADRSYDNGGDCTACTNCSNCTDCTICSGCTNCSGCTECTQCTRCTECSNCTNTCGHCTHYTFKQSSQGGLTPADRAFLREEIAEALRQTNLSRVPESKEDLLLLESKLEEALAEVRSKLNSID